MAWERRACPGMGETQAGKKIRFPRPMDIFEIAKRLKLRQDPELWDANGDTLVYFSQGYQDPSFRLRSSILRETRSAVLSDLLSQGLVQKGNKSEKCPRGVLYKLYIGMPSQGSKTDILRHHITTRNFFAFLSHKTLVGFTFYQILVDLNERLERYLPTTVDCSVALQSYLVTVGLVNVSNEPRASAGLLAWSEDVRWNHGWREAYVCVYMISYICLVKHGNNFK